MEIINKQIVIIGLGYVGLPICVEFKKKGLDVLGIDINELKVEEIKKGVSNGILTSKDEVYLAEINFSTRLEKINKARVYIVTVPTPVTSDKIPDLTPLISASHMISQVLTKRDIVIFESTVYPGATEEICLPELIRESAMVLNEDFFLGYSPERINPGDTKNTLTNINKIISASNDETLQQIGQLYSYIIEADLHFAPSIKVAEAAKVVENIQRDVNIALVNELEKIFDNLDINIIDVIEAASTKWNFMKLKPGLVGGHCIGIDPYYLIHKAKVVGQSAQIIERAREINESHVDYYMNKILKFLIKENFNINMDKVLFYGLTFKPDCEDMRNSKSIELAEKLEKFGVELIRYYPNVNY